LNSDDTLRQVIERSVGASGTARWRRAGPTGWGDAWLLAIDRRRYFVKVATGRHADMLASEGDGLRAIGETGTVRVPNVVAAGSEGDRAYLALEWLDLSGPRDDAALGRALAALHRAAPPRGPHGERFGWHRDNWIGGTPQSNEWSDDWGAFFRDRRLAPQLTLAVANGFGARVQREGERLLAALPSLLRGHPPEPSLVHGDLWSGNAATLATGEPLVFDPAVYIGDREVDVAMTGLFGGFGAGFLAAYRELMPLDAGYPWRRDAYNLYHLLNHLNLFGASYLAHVERTLARLR
jgi:protein-ribulosamine 3-kinase